MAYLLAGSPQPETERSPAQNAMKKLLFALIIYTACLAYFTYPLCFEARDHLASLSGPGDPYLNLWILSWVNHAVSTHPLHLFDANIFYPSRSALAYSDHLFLQSLTAMPVLTATRDIFFSYNFVLAISLLLCAAGAFALAYDLTRSMPAALLAGLIFGFAPFHFSHLDHLQLQSAGWIPLTILFLRRFFADPTLRRALLASLCFSFQVLSSGYLAVALTVAVLLFIPWFLYRLRKSWKQALKATIPSLALISILAAPFLIPYVRLTRQGNFERTLFMASNTSAVPASYLRAPEVNRFYGTPGSGLADPERSLFPGYSVLLLAGLGAGLLLFRRKADPQTPPDTAESSYFLALGVAGFVLSLGPSGKTGPVYRFLYDHMFGFRAIRAPARFSILVLLSLAILAAAALARLARPGPNPVRAIVVILFAFLLPGIEYSNLEIPYFKPDRGTPEIYNWLGRQPGDFAVIEIPMHKDEKLDTVYMLHSRAHWKSLVNGYSGNRPPYYHGFIEKMASFPDPESLLLLREINVRYAIVHNAGLDSASSGALLARLSGFERLLPPAARFGSDSAYEIRIPPEEKEKLLQQMVAQKAVHQKSSLGGAIFFSPGEELHFQVQWASFLAAGRATLSSEKGPGPQRRSACIYRLQAETSRWFSPIYEGRYTMRTFTDCPTGELLRTEMIQVERERKSETWCDYHPEAGYAESKEGIRFPVLPGARDPLSALFAVRAAPLRAGGEYTLEVQDMGRDIRIEIAVNGPEATAVPAGAFEALRLDCRIRRQLDIRPEIPLRLWLSNDERRLPLRADVELPVGNASILLESFSGSESP
jgi:hypothetical protein